MYVNGLLGIRAICMLTAYLILGHYVAITLLDIRA